MGFEIEAPTVSKNLGECTAVRVVPTNLWVVLRWNAVDDKGYRGESIPKAKKTVLEIKH